MILDRNSQPSIKQIESFNITKAGFTTLPNGTPFYTLNTGNSEMVKVELMFKAGNWYQSSPLVAFAANNMLMEGSSKFNSLQIAETIEFYGGYLGYNVDKDNAYVSMMCMKRHFREVLDVVENLIKAPTYPDHELDIFRNKHKQQFLVEQTKLKNIARFINSRMLFGNTHPYGYMVNEVDFNNLTRQTISQFHSRYYLEEGCKIIASGKVGAAEIQAIEQVFGNSDLSGINSVGNSHKIEPESEKKIFIERPDAVQSAVRIGKILVNKDHSDYVGLTVLNCILGGYFGSRLMKKIREEKGYTYGINSLFITLKNAGYLTIVSELGTSVTTEAVSAIYEEIEQLRNVLVPNEELQRVKNYMLGEMVRMFDGPFAQAESLISLLEYDLSYSHFDEIIKGIKNIDAEEIRLLAQKYFEPSSFSEVIVGKLN